MQRYSSHTISSPRLCVSAFDASSRRGNTIILVIGILTLLVIIATGYVTRTQGARGGAIATGQAALREDNADNVAKYLAQDISDALFVRRINAASVMMPDPIPTLGVLDSNTQRLPLDSQSIRFSWDGYAPYNVAPYHVVPVTNWPDSNAASNRWPTGPGNTGSIDPIVAPLLAAESNAIGFPGTSDCRWLRDIEPLRWDSWNDAINPTGPGSDGVLDAFSHWRHVSYPPRPDNAIRAITDTADIGDATGPGNLPDGWGSLITNLNVPIEQWLAVRPNNVAGDLYSGFSGNPYVEGTPTDAPRPFLPFWNRWNNWFNFYETTYTDPNLVPTNCYKLNDLDANLTRHDWYISGVPQDRPESEFIPGTARNAVSRVLCDTDGNGYTDSFWFTVPGTVQDGIMQIMGVSIIDNCAMLNANVATRFLRNDFGAPFVPPGVIVPQPKKTIGVTPADVALLANMAIPAPGAVTFNNWNVGFYDSPDNQAANTSYPDFASNYSPGGDGGQWIYWPAMSDRHFGELNFPQLPAAALWVPTHQQRLEWWRRSAARPLSSDPTARYTPFNLADELELRMFYGQNYPWIYSRFEHSFEDFTIQSPPAPSPISRFLRAQTGREESSEYLNQLYNRQLVADHRHRLTLYNAARNDIAPPWLWQWGPNDDVDGPGGLLPGDLGGDGDNNGDGDPVDPSDRIIFEWGQRKFDLRIGHNTRIYGDFDSNTVGTSEPAIESDVFDLTVPLTSRSLGIALRDRIERALMDDPLSNLPSNPGTYYGQTFPDHVNATRELSASFAANIREWRDRDDPSDITYTGETAFLVNSVLVKDSLGNTTDQAFIGMEPQPFILEVLIAHDYKAQPVVPATDPNGNVYFNHDQYVLLEDDVARSTIVVIQIANPFDRPIDLRDYNIRVFGQPLDLRPNGAHLPTGPVPSQAPTWPWLAPGTPDRPSTAIFYAMKDTTTTPFADPANVDELKSKWINFLNIQHLGPDGSPSDDDDITPESMAIDVTATGAWDVNDRDIYDDYDPPVEDGTVVLSRIDDPTSAIPVWVDVDRVDPTGAASTQQFRNEVNDLQNVVIDDPPAEPPGLYVVPLPGDPYPGFDFQSSVAEGRNHWVQWVRYTRAWGVDVNRDSWYDDNEKNPRFVFGNGAVIRPTGGTTLDGSYVLNTNGNKYRFDDDPDGITPPATKPWFTRTYHTIDNQVQDGVTVPFVRPFFFDMNRRLDPAWVPATSPVVWSLPDKGWYGQANGPDGDTEDASGALVQEILQYPFQLLHKDGDFEQVGELLNVPLFGHKVNVTIDFSVNPPTINYGGTTTTFSEYMANDSTVTGIDVGDGVRANRLRLFPAGNAGGEVIGVGVQNDVTDPRHAIPDLPAGVRLLDAFVCDGYGVEPYVDLNGNGIIEPFEESYRNSLVFSNARNYEGTGTPGMININTAPPEVMRALPHWYRLVHETGGQLINPVANPYFNAAGQPLVTDGSDPLARLPRSMVADGTVQYRERFNAGAGLPTVPVTGVLGGANYEDRPTLVGGTLRGDRGIASIGEPLLLARSGIATFGYIDLPAGAPQDRVFNQYWRMDMGVEPAPLANPPIPAKPFWTGSTSADEQVSMRLSTDRVDEFDWENSDVFVDPPVVRKRPDTTAGDVEEANMLFAGASNIITTRSDTFTVYFRIRSFRQNTSVSPPVWDATNKDYIVDDSRYVMLVDRSTVNRPTDKPKILYLEKLPN